MESLLLCFEGRPVGRCELGRVIEVGSDAGCDIVVPDRSVADRHVVVQRKAGAVVAYDVRDGCRDHGRILHLGEPCEIGPHYSIVRVREHREARTELIAGVGRAEVPLVLAIGRGPEARRRRLEDTPLYIGAGKHNDVVLDDRAVSGRHVRIHREGEGAFVRDLASRNGTYVDGLRVEGAYVSAGARLRVGRTELRLERDGPSEGFIAESPAMIELLAFVDRVAALDWPAVVLGESGSGKEGIARRIHARGKRAKQPFVAWNAAALSPDLVQSELFGHERGAFTGAAGERRGLFEQASGGVLFIDEVAELTPDVQARLLRVLETNEVTRVGGERAISVDVRLVSATHASLPAKVDAGEFRLDLWYRLARVVVNVPPLRERPEDVRALAQYFLAEMAGSVGARSLTESALRALCAYEWPGNARELRNVLSAAALSTSSATIEREDVAAALDRSRRRSPSPTELARTVEMHRGNVSAAARALGVSRETLRDRIRKK